MNGQLGCDGVCCCRWAALLAVAARHCSLSSRQPADRLWLHFFSRHVEIDGNVFPFSRGVSFYEMDAQGKILRARHVLHARAFRNDYSCRVGDPANSAIAGTWMCNGRTYYA